MISTSLLIYILILYVALLFFIIIIIFKILNAYWAPSASNILKTISFFYYGHRGAPTIAPENTLLSFKEAINSNMNGIELDVQITKDNKLIII